MQSEYHFPTCVIRSPSTQDIYSFLRSRHAGRRLQSHGKLNYHRFALKRGNNDRSFRGVAVWLAIRAGANDFHLVFLIPPLSKLLINQWAHKWAAFGSLGNNIGLRGLPGHMPTCIYIQTPPPTRYVALPLTDSLATLAFIWSYFTRYSNFAHRERW